MPAVAARAKYEISHGEGKAMPAPHTHRLLPDFSFDADPVSGAYIAQASTQSQTAVGGTVLAAAIYAGLSARMYGTGNAAPASFTALGSFINELDTVNQANNTSYTREQLLRPVNIGNNGYGGYGYQAVVGYDGASGWGSINTIETARLLDTGCCVK